MRPRFWSRQFASRCFSCTPNITHNKRLPPRSSPDNEPGQLFQMTEGDYVDTTLQLIGSQAMPTYLNNTSYSAALVSNGSSPKYVEITYNKGGVSPITPSDTSLILTLSDD